MGHHDVFMHVGDHVRIHAPNGKSVAPIVTGTGLLYLRPSLCLAVFFVGTFGSSDFIHSLLGGKS